MNCDTCKWLKKEKHIGNLDEVSQMKKYEYEYIKSICFRFPPGDTIIVNPEKQYCGEWNNK